MQVSQVLTASIFCLILTWAAPISRHVAHALQAEELQMAPNIDHRVQPVSADEPPLSSSSDDLTVVLTKRSSKGNDFRQGPSAKAGKSNLSNNSEDSLARRTNSAHQGTTSGSTLQGSRSRSEEQTSHYLEDMSDVTSRRTDSPAHYSTPEPNIIWNAWQSGPIHLYDPQSDTLLVFGSTPSSTSSAAAAPPQQSRLHENRVQGVAFTEPATHLNRNRQAMTREEAARSRRHTPNSDIEEIFDTTSRRLAESRSGRQSAVDTGTNNSRGDASTAPIRNSTYHALFPPNEIYRGPSAQPSPSTSQRNERTGARTGRGGMVAPGRSSQQRLGGRRREDDEGGRA